MDDRGSVDRADILARILQRQAIRRDAHLPLLDVPAEYTRAVRQALWTRHVERHYERVRARVVAERRRRHGLEWGLSAGGRWLIEIETARLLKKMHSLY